MTFGDYIFISEYSESYGGIFVEFHDVGDAPLYNNGTAIIAVTRDIEKTSQLSFNELSHYIRKSDHPEYYERLNKHYPYKKYSFRCVPLKYLTISNQMDGLTELLNRLEKEIQ